MAGWGWMPQIPADGGTRQYGGSAVRASEVAWGLLHPHTGLLLPCAEATLAVLVVCPAKFYMQAFQVAVYTHC